MLLLSAANDVPKIQRVSPLAKALFKPLPGTKSDKQMTAASLRSDTTVLYQKPWGKVSDSSPLSSKIGENELYDTNEFYSELK
jgi:hypothetical protein